MTLLGQRPQGNGPRTWQMSPVCVLTANSCLTPGPENLWLHHFGLHVTSRPLLSHQMQPCGLPCSQIEKSTPSTVTKQVLLRSPLHLRFHRINTLKPVPLIFTTLHAHLRNVYRVAVANEARVVWLEFSFSSINPQSRCFGRTFSTLSLQMSHSSRATVGSTPKKALQLLPLSCPRPTMPLPRRGTNARSTGILPPLHCKVLIQSHKASRFWCNRVDDRWSEMWQHTEAVCTRGSTLHNPWCN